MRPIAARAVAWGAGGAALPCAAWIAALALERQWPLALARTPRLLSVVASDAFVVEAWALTIAAPIAGAAAIAAERRGASAPRLLAAGLLACAGASLAIGMLASAAGGPAPALLFQGHAVLFVAGAALAAFGAACAAFMPDVLDAAALALLATLVLAAGLFAVGPAAAGLSEAAMNAGLLASPPIAITSAAGIDLLRTELLYRLTPIAHRRFAYPGWAQASLAYAVVASLSAIAARNATLITRRKVRQR